MSGRFDGDDKKSTFQKYKYSILLFFMTGMMIGFFALSPVDSNKTDLMCEEVTRLMLDDPDHQRLHNQYPTIMNELHMVIDKKCDKVDEDELLMDDSNQIKINIGEP